MCCQYWIIQYSFNTIYTENSILVLNLYPAYTELHLIEGDELLLVCSATGVPTPLVILLDNEQSKQKPKIYHQFFSIHHANKSQAVLHKYNLQKKDEGLYLCVAGNYAGNAEKYVHVYVKSSGK